MGSVAAIVCGAANLVAASTHFKTLLTLPIGLLSGLIALPAIRFAKSSAEDADVFQLLAIRIEDPTASEVDRRANCRRAWEYIEGRLKQSRG